jgi:hypothetical protein
MRAKAFDAVRRLTINGLIAPPRRLTMLTEAHWFRRLRHLRVRFGSPPDGAVFVGDLGRLPDLHTLDLPDLPPAVLPNLNRGEFPSLARLVIGCPLSRMTASALAAARFRRLSVFTACRCQMNNDEFLGLLRAEWFGQLRALNISANALGEKSITTLAASSAARSLCVLRLGDNGFGKTGLNSLARAGAFPQLCALDLGSFLKRKATQDDVAAFLSALSLPQLRHLDLSGWPVGDEGAKVIAASPAFAGLTRLDLARCRIGDAGARALLASPYLQKLVRLRLDANTIRDGLDDLADPAIMPRMAECCLGSNDVPRATVEKIRSANRFVSG